MATSKQGQKEKINKIDVELALVKRGWKQIHLAQAIGKPLSTVNVAINHGEHPNVIKLIKQALDL